MKVFVKFGEAKYLRRTLLYNQFYFGIAQVYKRIETEQLIKGQGDGGEATIRVKVESGQMIQLETGDKTEISNGSEIEIVNQEAAHIPVYCISLIDTEQNCIISNGKRIISPEFMSVIRAHFPKADSALVFTDWLMVEKAFGKTFSYLKSSTITYPWMPDVGVSVEYIEKAFSEITEEEFNSDIPGLIMKGKLSSQDDESNRYFATTKETAYKCLFCKDPYFAGEQEYRFLLPKIRLECGKEYTIRGIPKTKKHLMSLDEFENNYSFPPK